MRLLIYRLLREDDFCRGNEIGDHYRYCPEALVVRCGGCGNEWEPDDTNAPGACPGCGERLAEVQRCPECPVLKVDYVRYSSPAGRLLNRVLELEFDVKNFSVDWGDLTAEEVLGLRILDQERGKRTNEEREEMAERQEMDQRIRNQQQRR